MVALDKNDRLIDRVSEFNSRANNRPTLAFYAYHGHLLLLTTKESIKQAIDTGRAHALQLETTHTNQLLIAEESDKPDGVFEVHDSYSDLDLYTLPGGVNILRTIVDLRPLVLNLMDKHHIEPRIKSCSNGSITSFEFKNENKEKVHIYADAHPGEFVDHEVLRKIAEENGIQYTPDKAMGNIVTQLMSTFEGNNRRSLCDVEKNRIVQEQNGLCACGCGTVLSKKPNGKWDAEFDHKIALADGGSNETSNFQALTTSCHKAKSSEEVERGYSHKKEYASQLNGHVHNQLFPNRPSPTVAAIQHVQAFWTYDGATVVLRGHPYWEDGTKATLSYQTSTFEEGRSLTRIEVMDNSQAKATPHGDPCSAKLSEMTYDTNTLLNAPSCKEVFKMHVEYRSSQFEERKMDANRCRRNALYYSEYEFPVFNTMDEIKPFDGQSVAGVLRDVIESAGAPNAGKGRVLFGSSSSSRVNKVQWAAAEARIE